MSKLNNVRKLRRAITFLFEHDCYDMDLDLVAEHDGSVKVSTEPSRVKQSEVRVLKRAFGPFKNTPSWSYERKNLAGEVEHEGVRIKFELNGALSCQKYQPEELTDDKWDSIKAAVLRGEISIPNCKPAEYKSEEKGGDDDN